MPVSRPGRLGNIDVPVVTALVPGTIRMKRCRVPARFCRSHRLKGPVAYVQGALTPYVWHSRAVAGPESSRSCRLLDPGERRAEHPRHVHLRVADPVADLPLSQVLHKAQLEHLALDLG